MLPSLHYISDYILPQEEQYLIQQIDEQIWTSPFKRRVQHYGYIYDYKKHTVTEEKKHATIGNMASQRVNQTKSME